MTVLDLPGPARPGIFRKFSAWWGPRPLAQVLLILAVIGMFWYLGANTAGTLDRLGVKPGFDFLSRNAPFEIGETMIPYKAGDSYTRAILVGLLNTIKVALLGCVLATLLGVTLGIARLSGNLLLANLVRWYVEVIRNIPLLLQLFFWSAVTHAFPPPKQAINAFDAVFLSSRGVYIPSLGIDGGPAWLGAFVTIGAVVAGLLIIAFGRRLRFRGTVTALAATLLALVGTIALAGSSLVVEVPQLGGFNIRGGWTLTPEFTALLIGLVVKFSASIAEIVRAGIESVSSGQWEAARALGLHPRQILRLIVLPQALRVITPLATSSYLDLTKDSSLAVAIGYPDLVNVINTSSNTTGQSLETLAILVAVYLTLNLSVSALMNLYNRRVALRGESPR